MHSNSDESYSTAICRLILISPFIPYLLVQIFMLCAVIFKVKIGEETIQNVFNNMSLLYIILGYGFYCAFWVLKEKKNIYDKRIKYLVENNVFLTNVLKECKYINYANLPVDLKQDLFVTYFDTVCSITKDTKSILADLSGRYYNDDYKDYISDNDKELYNRIMESACVTPEDYINTKHWKLIEEAIMLSIHYNAYSDILLSNHLNKTAIFEYYNAKYYKECMWVCRASKFMRILGYDDWEEFKQLIDAVKEKVGEDDITRMTNDENSDYELSHKACKELVSIVNSEKPEIRELKIMFDDNVLKIKWGYTYSY